MRYELDGRKISKAEAEKIVGKERLAQMIQWVKQEPDPYAENSWWVGNGMLSIYRTMFGKG